ncbi:MAG: hypothetical protein MJZ02_04260, partial [Paludibacteraceae bacterium]|nr:hypothetical protein [Paludibacteraceae bacterium]
SNLGPSACKADALNQLSYEPDFLDCVAKLEKIWDIARLYRHFFEENFKLIYIALNNKALQEPDFSRIRQKQPSASRKKQDRRESFDFHNGPLS